MCVTTVKVVCPQAIIFSQQRGLFRFQFQTFSHYQQKDISWRKSKSSPTISFILCQLTDQVSSSIHWEDPLIPPIITAFLVYGEL